ncbi:MAG: hypothetical protein JNK64_40490 [Myxococcales bacterium]|nr:hypothetical protein [Myxococcales bacterium]
MPASTALTISRWCPCALAALLAAGCGRAVPPQRPAPAAPGVATCGRPLPAPAPRRAATPMREPMPWEPTPAPPTAPRASAPELADLDTRAIDVGLRANRASLLRCMSAPDLAGGTTRVDLRIAIRPDGHVGGAEVRADDVDAGRLACVCAAVWATDFGAIGAPAVTRSVLLFSAR